MSLLERISSAFESRVRDITPPPLIRSRNVGSKTYLKELRSLFPISRILYPGSMDDFGSLEEAFSKKEIIYLDIEPIPRNTSWRKRWLNRIFRPTTTETRNLVTADASKPPFNNGVFDATFMQDMHAPYQTLNSILRMLKDEGILIFSTNDCGDKDGVQPPDLGRHPRLITLDLPFNTKYYTSYRKLPAKIMDQK